MRDLAVAAYALRSRGMQLDVLLLDGSHDDAVEVAERAAMELGLPLVRVPGPASGPGEACLAGFSRVVSEGRADLVVTLDANGRHDAMQIPHLIDHLVEGGYHVVIGSRWTRGSGTPGLSAGRWVLGKVANLTFRLLTTTRGIADATTSFRVARMEVLRDFHFTGIPVNSYSVHTAFVAMAIARGHRVGEAPIIYRQPTAGSGGLRVRDVHAFATHLLALRRSVDQTRQGRLSVPGRKFADDYFGAVQDLERLGSAKHFFDWVLDEFDPYLRGRVLEVGAGTGTITRKLIDRYPDLSVVALEPAGNLFSNLHSYAALTARVLAHQKTLLQYEVDPHERFDVVLYLNVIEHIADDDRELRMAAEVLRPGGALLVFGPALEWLYSELDYQAGHYRRYGVSRLGELAAGAGLQVVAAQYFDPMGVLPYYVVYKLLGHTEISGSTLWSYDRMVVPMSRLIQRLVRRPPVGKNVILVALKR